MTRSNATYMINYIILHYTYTQKLPNVKYRGSALKHMHVGSTSNQ